MDISVLNKIKENVNKVVVGKEEAIDLLLAALLVEGHVLLEDVPGTGKTLLAKSIAKSIGGVFKRIQFTPDLLPTDVTGFKYYDMKAGSFKYQEGPIMTNVLLADEINRTIPRTQSSLLESMGEYQLTVDNTTYHLPRPFFVMATQNPIDLEGTYPLPEAQLDRFLFKINLGYPSFEEELSILERFRFDDPINTLQSITTPEEVYSITMEIKNTHVSNKIKEYIINIVNETRNSTLLKTGASPRASLALMKASQALAVLNGRDFVLPDDIKSIVNPVLVHRLRLSDKERMKGTSCTSVLSDIIEAVKVPSV